MDTSDLAPRIITQFGVRLLTEEDTPLAAQPVNLSENGVCVRTTEALTKGQPLTLEIALAQRILTIPARVIWTRRDQTNQQTYCGLGFAKLTDTQRRDIQTYVEQGARQLLTFFSEFPLFSDFSAADCRLLLRIVTLRQLDRQQVLYHQGDEDNDLQGLFIVQDGLLAVFKGPQIRDNRRLAVISTGEIFGETTLVCQQPHSATIMAVNPARLIQINKIGFRLLREQQPVLALKIMDIVAQTLSRRLGRTTEMLFSPLRS